MIASDINPVELKVFLNHIYELKKGVRQMVLYTTKRKYEDFAVKRLINQKINYIIQPVGNDKINLFFGRKECINAIRFLVNQPLNKLSPEQDFILGAMLGYDICVKYSDYVIDDADYVVTPDNEWYILDLENKQIDKELKVKVDKNGVWL